MNRIWLLALMLLGFGLARGALATEHATTDEPPAAVFAALEQRLLGAGAMRLGFHAQSEGAFVADIRGTLSVGRDGEIQLTGRGVFGGQPVDLRIRTRGDGYEFGNGASLVSAPLPAHLKEALLIGLTRMGILHNLALLSSAAAPDHADGGVQEWVVADVMAGDSANAAALGFEVVVAGERAGKASLELDARACPWSAVRPCSFRTGRCGWWSGIRP